MNLEIVAVVWAVALASSRLRSSDQAYEAGWKPALQMWPASPSGCWVDNE